MRAERVVRVLEQLRDWRGLPRAIRCDNGPEYTAQSVVDWCRDHGIELRYIQPGKPNQNAYTERFSRTYRNEVLDAHLFEDLTRSGRSPTPGCNATTTNARTNRSAICHRASITTSGNGKPLLTSALLDGEGCGTTSATGNLVAGSL